MRDHHYAQAKKPGNAGHNAFRIQDYTLDECLSHLQGVIECGTGYKALCPSHRDTNPSLSINIGKNGRPVLHCHAGCSYDSIMAAMGLDRPDTRQPSRQPTTKQITALYDYCDEQGLLLYQKVRYEPKSFVIRRPDGVGWTWSKGDTRPVLYRLPEVIQAIAAGKVIFIPEGEKDVDRLRSAGLVATTNIEGASEPGKRPKWRREYSEQLAGAPRVVLLPDSDPAGEAHAEYIARQLAGKVDDIRLVELPGLPPKGDVSDWLDAGHTTNELLALAEAIAPYANPAQDHHNAEAPERERPPLSAYEDAPEAQGTRDRSAGAGPGTVPGQTGQRPDTGKSNIVHVSVILDRQPNGNQLIKGWMGTGEFALLFGESGSFKTLIALEMVIAIVLGKNWRGHKVQQGAVLYIAGEGGGYGLTKRLQAYQIAHQVSLKDAPLFIREAPTLLPADTATLIEEIRAALDGTGLELVLVVADTLSRTMQGDENSAEDFARYQQALDSLKHHFGCARLVVSHVGHVEKGRPKGTYQLIGNPDCLLQTSADISLEPQQRISQLISTKQKDAELPKSKAFKLAVMNLGCTDSEGDAVTGVALLEVQDYQPPAPPKPLGANEKLLLSILNSRGPMLEGDLRRVFVNTLEQLKPDQAYNTSRMAWVRAYGTLKTDGRIVVDDTFTVRVSA